MACQMAKKKILPYQFTLHLACHFFDVAKLRAKCIVFHGVFLIVQTKYTISRRQFNFHSRKSLQLVEVHICKIHDCLVLLNVKQIRSKTLERSPVNFKIIEIHHFLIVIECKFWSARQKQRIPYECKFSA
jgi:hypothetical protein